MIQALTRFTSCFIAASLFTFLTLSFETIQAAEPKLSLEKEDHIAYIGNTLADRMQHHAWLETYLHAMFPEHDLTIRNLAVPGDELNVRPREDNFGSPDEWLSKVEADVIFNFFGYNEAMKGPNGLDEFRKQLESTIDGMQSQNYNGKSAPTLVFFSPIAHENLNSRHLPDGEANNKNLELYTEAMRDVCQSKQVLYVDLFHPSQKLYESSEKPLTMNGVHLLSDGNRVMADVMIKELFGKENIDLDAKELERLRQAILVKNDYWFNRYRVVDGYNVFGGRSKLAWFGQSNADVMMREMEIFDVMTANRDKRVWAVARGGDLEVKDDNLPQELEVKTNKPGNLDDGSYSYLGGEEAISKMTIAKGMEVNLFASEEMFPELINPVQMAVDTDGKLYASVWPSYPHWNPTEKRRDRIVCLPDENADGVADECIIFADELNSVTGFEFWGGGMLVAALPELWFLKDTDGDHKADVKIRMLQGLSSADSHHSANAMVLGPDGWLYWSRGVFNVANIETPTKTFRAGSTGVYRFNPRTFEMEFHFPIGPNPHGDVFDQWGYQFANDGTSGTGSYVNIGKGVGNKHWFKKRVRPVAATGILSSSQFPEENQGNFLICNCIGFLGVLQHEVKYDGADITCEEIEPILVSDDPNFRPTDVEIGSDGALYVSDWSNALIGHMQHNMRDPNRDHEHGRIYRVTAKDRPLVMQPNLKGAPIAEVCKSFFAKENATRYRARIELSGRETDEVVKELKTFVKTLDVTKPDDAQAMLECLWVFEEHRVPNLELIKTLYKAKEPLVRAAAIRTLGHWGTQIEGWEPVLIAASADESPLVRAEAVKSAVAFSGVTSAEVVFNVATQPTDVELDVVIKYALSQIPVDKLLQEVMRSKGKLSPAARKYALKNSSPEDLLAYEQSAEVYEAILSRTNTPVNSLRQALNGFAELQKSNPASLLMKLMAERDQSNEIASLAGLGVLLQEQPADSLKKVRNQLEKFALDGKNDATRRSAIAALITTDGSGENAYFLASKSKEHLQDFLAAVPLIESSDLRSKLYPSIRSLVFELPPNLSSDGGQVEQRIPGIHVDFYYPSPSNVAIETLAKLKPQDSGIVPEIVMNVPQKTQNDKFALQFKGFIDIPKSGDYTFFIKSDDGSRIYLDDKLLINHDGLHGFSEKNGKAKLTAGLHPLTVTYFDNGGGDGLEVNWSGPGIKKQKIPASVLFANGGQSLQQLAVISLGSIPGHDAEKFKDLSELLKRNKYQQSAIRVMRDIPEENWPETDSTSLIDNLIGYLSNVPVASRTNATSTDAIAIVRSLASRLPQDEAGKVLARLDNLDVRVIAIGTVPARMIYDKEIIAVEAGKPVEFRFSNSDHMPHNFAIILPGSLEEVGNLAEDTARQPDAKEREYIPVSDKILLGSRLLEPGEKQALTFEVPKTPGVYPYVCTYPGHWRRMYGALYVVEDLKAYQAYQADPAAYLSSHSLEIKDELLKFANRNTEWKYDDLASSLPQVMHGRSFEVGRSLFKVANCVACHKLNNEGKEIGPDLTKLDPKKQNLEYLLRSLIEPSKEIEEKYQSNTFVLASGKVVTGMIVKETDDEIQLLVDPMAKADPITISVDDIDDQVKSKLSIMPAGLLNKLTEEEILDLLAYIYAQGDMKHKMYSEHMHHP